MRFVGMCVIGGIALAWLCGGVIVVARGLRRPWNWRTPASIAAGIFCLYGIAGFFGSGFASTGGLDWLGAFEWPVGYTSGVVRTHDGKYIVPHEPTDRIQIYDANLHFLRGWRVAAGSGALTADVDADDHIHAYVARGDWHLVYDTDGRILSQSHYDPRQSPGVPANAISVRVPTRWWLWPLTGPFYGWLCAMVFLALFFATGRRGRNKLIVRPARSA